MNLGRVIASYVVEDIKETKPVAEPAPAVQPEQEPVVEKETVTV